MGNMFVEFTNVIQAFYAELPPGAAEDDALLAWIYARNHQQRPVRVTDLVRAGRFGTLPTLHKRLRALDDAGLLETAVGPDRRTRLVVVSAAGVSRLDSRSAMLQQVTTA